MSTAEHPKAEAVLDPHALAAWRELVAATAATLDEFGARTDILFHGTTDDRAERIMADGMRPTMAFEVVGDDEQSCQGSFWGTVEVAAWWAVSAATNRGGRPVLVAIATEDLARIADLGIDIPSRDFPQTGAEPFDDPVVAARWAVGEYPTWEDSLLDLGSLTAIHDDVLSMDSAMIFDTVESLNRILGFNRFSA